MLLVRDPAHNPGRKEEKRAHHSDTRHHKIGVVLMSQRDKSDKVHYPTRGAGHEDQNVNSTKSSKNTHVVLSFILRCHDGQGRFLP